MFSGSRNSLGFSMVEVMASIAALTIVALGVAKVNGLLAKTSLGTKATQQRTNLEQSLSAVFENAEICTTVLSGSKSEVGTLVYLPAALQTDEIIKAVKLESIKISELNSLNNNNYRAVLVVQGHKSGASEFEKFTSSIPVYYSVVSGKIANCFSTRSAYSTCLALKGTWNDTYCDFCSSLGGTRNASGACSIAQAPTPQPSATPSKKYVTITQASGYNGTRTHAIGNFGFCNLSSYTYDGDGIGECTVTHSGNSWFVTVGDEGTRHPQICNMSCVPVGTADTGGKDDGDLCKFKGKPGIMLGGCCSTGTQFKRVYRTSGFGKNQTTVFVGTLNDVGCHK